MLTMIGLGLSDEKDITVRGLEAVKKADRVFLEAYTSLLQCSREDLARFYGKQVEVLGRAGVEQQADGILDAAEKGDAAFLVIGDVFSATTHTDLFLRAKERGVDVRIVHNASVMNAVGQVGLDLYKYGRTTTFVYPQGDWAPDSFLDVIGENKKRGLHTLCLLDIKAEQGRFMTVSEAAEMLLERSQGKKLDVDGKTMAVGVARLGSKTQRIVYASLEELSKADFGKPPHTLIIPGKLHVIEEEMLAQWTTSSSSPA